MIKDVFVSQAASRQGGGIAPAQPRTWCGGERAKTNYCDCLLYALLTPAFQLPGEEEEEEEEKGVRGRRKTWFRGGWGGGVREVALEVLRWRRGGWAAGGRRGHSRT